MWAIRRIRSPLHSKWSVLILKPAEIFLLAVKEQSNHHFSRESWITSRKLLLIWKERWLSKNMHLRGSSKSFNKLQTTSSSLCRSNRPQITASRTLNSLKEADLGLVCKDRFLPLARRFKEPIKILRNSHRTFTRTPNNGLISRW